MVKVWANICRFLLAVVFIFSGFLKANDPLGMFYKLQEYLEAFGVSRALPFAYIFITGVVLGVIEFTLGIYLFFGIQRRRAAVFTLLLLSFLTPLTLWLAVANPISDCGCFAEAVKLTNWETFLKNVVLLVAAISVVRWKSHISKLVSVRFDWLISLYSIFFISIYSLFSYRGLPVFDFTPYRIGASIKEGMEIPEGEKLPVLETIFTYTRDGVEQEFTIDNFPKDTLWTFVKSKTVIKERGYEPPIQDFSITLQTDGTDITKELLEDDGYTFLLVAPYLAYADDSRIDLINEVYDYSVEHGYRFLCVTNSNDDDIARWQEDTGAEYPFGIMDDTPLRTMVRSNPGLVLIKGGRVYAKWSDKTLPDEYTLNAPLEELPMGRASRKTVRRKIVETVCWFICPLAAFTLCDVVWFRVRKRKIKREAGKEQTLHS